MYHSFLATTEPCALNKCLQLYWRVCPPTKQGNLVNTVVFHNYIWYLKINVEWCKFYCSSSFTRGWVPNHTMEMNDYGLVIIQINAVTETLLSIQPDFGTWVSTNERLQQEAVVLAIWFYLISIKNTSSSS